MPNRVKCTIKTERTWQPALVAWAAGLFEGEGCFSITRDRNQLTAVITMTDLDVLRTFHEVVGIGYIYSITSPSARLTPNGNLRKPMWRWGVGGNEGVQAVLAMFWPWLHQRRRERGVEILRLWRVGPKRIERLQLRAHGSYSMYTHGCRCDDCRVACVEHSRKYRSEVRTRG